jgi:hypothetical protein
VYKYRDTKKLRYTTTETKTREEEQNENNYKELKN